MRTHARAPCNPLSAHSRSAARVRACSGNTAVAIPGTLVFAGVVAYFAMMASDEAARERERVAAAGGRREELDD